MAYRNPESKNKQQKRNRDSKISQNAPSQIFDQRLTWQSQRLTWRSQLAWVSRSDWGGGGGGGGCDSLDKFYLRVTCIFSFRLAKGGNKDQLWFSPEKKKQTGCTVAKGGVRRKKKLYCGCIT